MSSRRESRRSVSVQNTYKITGFGNNPDISRKYFLIDGIILPRQGITKITTSRVYLSSYCRTSKYCLTIHYGWFSRWYKFRFDDMHDMNSIMDQLLRCVNYEI
jgi:hypothetical protein